jgi:large subunit ribosomal protein L19
MNNTNNELSTKTINKKEKIHSTDYIKLVEEKFLKNHDIISPNQNKRLEIGDIVRVGYLIQEGNKERTQYYEGLVISQSNRGLGKSFTIRRSIQGVGVEQVFLLHSPKIVSITKKQSSKVRRAKLYFIRELSGKSTRLKVKL